MEAVSGWENVTSPVRIQINYEELDAKSIEVLANSILTIPADKLEGFIEELSAMGTLTSKTIGSDDITNSYIDVESRIKALETEQEALLGILEKAENLSDVISLQDRLSVVRADLEALKALKQSYDEMVAYSEIAIDIREVERVVESDDTFFGEAKEKLMKTICRRK